MSERTTTCTYHCGSCGRHFHSLASFDTHRVGDFSSSDPETRRRCLDPLDVLDGDGQERLEALTREGVCRVYEPQEGITVWTLHGSVERAQALWSKS